MREFLTSEREARNVLHGYCVPPPPVAGAPSGTGDGDAVGDAAGDGELVGLCAKCWAANAIEAVVIHDTASAERNTGISFMVLFTPFHPPGETNKDPQRCLHARELFREEQAISADPVRGE